MNRQEIANITNINNITSTSITSITDITNIDEKGNTNLRGAISGELGEV